MNKHYFIPVEKMVAISKRLLEERDADFSRARYSDVDLMQQIHHTFLYIKMNRIILCVTIISIRNATH